MKVNARPERLSAGVSEQQATLILIGVVLIACIIIYPIFTGYLSIFFGMVQVSVESASLIRSSEGCAFACTLKNSGSKPIKEIFVRLDGEGPHQVLGGGRLLEPGRSASVLLTTGSGLEGDYVVGESYTVTVFARRRWQRFHDGLNGRVLGRRRLFQAVRLRCCG